MTRRRVVPSVGLIIITGRLSVHDDLLSHELDVKVEQLSIITKWYKRDHNFNKFDDYFNSLDIDDDEINIENIKFTHMMYGKFNGSKY